MVNKILMVWILFLMTFSASAFAEESIARPEEVVHGAATRLIEVFTDNKEKVRDDQTFVVQMVYDVLFPIVDTRRMARIALGKHWKTATKEQQKTFVVGFEKLLLKTYSTAFAAFNGQRVTFSAARFNKKGNKALVHSSIFREGAHPISVDFKLYKTKKKQWMVYDAVVDGMAIVLSLQSNFYKQIEETNLQNTIDNLEQKVSHVTYQE